MWLEKSSVYFGVSYMLCQYLLCQETYERLCCLYLKPRSSILSTLCWYPWFPFHRAVLRCRQLFIHFSSLAFHRGKSWYPPELQAEARNRRADRERWMLYQMLTSAASQPEPLWGITPPFSLMWSVALQPQPDPQFSCVRMNDAVSRAAGAPSMLLKCHFVLPRVLCASVHINKDSVLIPKH